MSPRSNRTSAKDTIIRKLIPMTSQVLKCTRDEAVLFLCKLSSEQRDGILALYMARIYRPGRRRNTGGT